MSTRRDIMVPRKKKDGGTYWVKIGTAWDSEKGTQLVFDALPIADSEGRCVANLFEPRDNDRARSAGNDRQQAQDRAGGQYQHPQDDSDSIPFATNESIW